MPVSNWWLVSDSLMKVMGGPFLWDGSSDWTPPSGQRAVNTDPTGQGYTWPAGSPVENLTAMNNRIAALEARLALEAHGRRSWPAVGLLALGGTNKQTVTLKTPLPSPDFTPSAILIGDVIIASLNVSAVSVVNAQQVDVTVKAALACNITANAFSVLVFADAN